MTVRAWLGAGVTLLASVAFIVGATTNPKRAAFSYLGAFTFYLTVAVGVLFWIMIGHATSAVWFVALRRSAERVLVAIPVLAVLFLPLLFAQALLYPQEASSSVADADPYSSFPLFVARAVVYLSVLCALSFLLRRWSLRQDQDSGAAYTSKLRALGSIGLPIAGLTLTFAAFDWLMALDANWHSTMYGVYVSAGAAVSGLACIAVLTYRDRRLGRLPNAIGVSHHFVMGKLLLTTVMFWAYIGFSQLLLIWIADLPAENVWYLARSAGSWSRVAWMLGLGHFAIPFLLLLSFRLKRSPGSVAAVGGWLLVAHYLDVYWLVLPALDRSGPRPHWLDLAALVAIGGISALSVALVTRRDRPLAIRDPRLERSLHFENA